MTTNSILFSGTSIIIPSGIAYSGGATLQGSDEVETVYLPNGSVQRLNNGHESSLGQSLDLNNIDASNIQVVTGQSSDWSGLVIGGIIDVVSPYTLTIVNGDKINNVVGGTAADQVIGNALSNVLYGGDYMDTLLGLNGNDTLYGGVGYADPNDEGDSIYGGGGADLIFGNAGNDYIHGGHVIDDVPDANSNFYGNYSHLNTEADGADFIYGGLGNDYILGNAGNDTIYGGGAAVDPVEGNDYIFGNSGDDHLYGNGGNDEITGGTGNDYLHGGMGDDIYIIGNGAGQDVIAHFQGAGMAGGDVLRLAANINGTSIDTIAELLANAISDSSGMWINLGGGNGLTIAGVSTFGADDVVFV